MSNLKSISNIAAMRMVIAGDKANRAKSIIVDPTSFFREPSKEWWMKVPYFIGNFSSKGLDAFKDVIAKTNQLIMLDSSTDPDEEDVSFLYVKTSRVCGYLPKFRFPKMLDSERAQKSKVKFEVVKGERLDFFMLDANTPLTMDEVQVSEFTLVFTRNQRGIVALASVVPGHLDRHQHHILSAGEYTLEELSQQELSGLVFNVFTDH